MFDISNRLYKIIAGFLIVLTIYFGFQAYFDYKTIPQNNVYPEMLSVSGEGKASIAPDVATVDLGITTEGVKVEDIVKTNTEKMNKVILEIKNLGIEEKDIKTINYSLQPRYDWSQNGVRISRGYTLTQTIKVKIRDFAKIGDALGVASDNGVNNIGDLQFTIDDLEKAKSIAREKAIDQAKQKAKLISQQTGLKLKKIINVYEDTGAYPYPAYDSVGMGASYKEAVSSVAPAPVIQTGEQEITVKITLNYRTK
ncbi:MAG: SIMPL domain-containing protein [Candidatus Pacebacteria bacterium]|nr:SIMPL domain-containing protein [Candidatus Paceibacterota bacterium]